MVKLMCLVGLGKSEAAVVSAINLRRGKVKRLVAMKVMSHITGFTLK